MIKKIIAVSLLIVAVACFACSKENPAQTVTEDEKNEAIRQDDAKEETGSNPWDIADFETGNPDPITDANIPQNSSEIYPMSFLYAIAISMVFSILVNLIMKREIRKIDMAQAMKAND